MTDDGFRVDLTALTRAADGVTGTIRSMSTTPVRDVDASPAAYGHAGLADSVAGFCDRWDAAVTGLVDDAGQIADRLVRCAESYRRIEHDLAAQLGGTVGRESGGDPAAQ